MAIDRQLIIDTLNNGVGEPADAIIAPGVFGYYSTGVTEYNPERAKELLLNSSDSVTEIAFSSGYNDIYYFNRVFRKAVNCSPMEFRKNRGRTGG